LDGEILKNPINARHLKKYHIKANHWSLHVFDSKINATTRISIGINDNKAKYGVVWTLKMECQCSALIKKWLPMVLFHS